MTFKKNKKQKKTENELSPVVNHECPKYYPTDLEDQHVHARGGDGGGGTIASLNICYLS